MGEERFIYSQRLASWRLCRYPFSMLFPNLVGGLPDLVKGVALLLKHQSIIAFAYHEKQLPLNHTISNFVASLNSLYDQAHHCQFRIKSYHTFIRIRKAFEYTNS